jgi:hypothetical protein
MFEGRMLDKSHSPNIQDIELYVGESSFKNIELFENMLKERYDLKKRLNSLLEMNMDGDGNFLLTYSPTDYF